MKRKAPEETRPASDIEGNPRRSSNNAWSFFYDRVEYLRTWKLTMLGAGVALLIIGSIYTPATDWDVPISLIMAIFSYFTAPCSVRVILEHRWRQLPAALFATWWSVDGCYALYWHFKDPGALELMRSANFPASLGLYGMCGVVWLYRGSLAELLVEIRNAARMRS